jgi:hypothetical protein
MLTKIQLDFILCSNFLNLVQESENKCLIYYNDNLMGFLSSLDSDLVKGKIFIVDVVFLQNTNTSCQLLYLTDQDPRKKHLKDLNGIDNILTFCKNDDGILDISYVSVVSQTVILEKGLMVKCLVKYKAYSEIYDKIILLAAKHYSFAAKKHLNRIQKAYLYNMLRLYRESKASIVKTIEIEPLSVFNLEEAWLELKYVNVLFQTATLNVHIDLVNKGILFYLNVNSYLIDSIRFKRWESLRSILSYYDCSKLIDRPVISLYLKTYPEVMNEMPGFLIEKLATLKHVKSQLRHLKFKI